MEKVHKGKFEAIKTAVSAVTPSGWDYRLANGAGRVTMEIRRAPIDLLAADGAAPGATCSKVNPTAYEDRADSPLGKIWKALHSENTVQFDGAGDRCGDWYAVELWIGHWRRPFAVTM